MSEPEDYLIRYTEKVSALLDKKERRLTSEELKELAKELGLSETDIALAEKEAEKHFIRGKGYLDHKLADEALEELESAMALSPGRSDIARAMAHTRALRFELKGAAEDRAAAQKLAEQLLEDDPKDQDAFAIIQRVRVVRAAPSARSRAPLIVAAMLLVMVVAGMASFLVLMSGEATTEGATEAQAPPVRPLPERQRSRETQRQRTLPVRPRSTKTPPTRAPRQVVLPKLPTAALKPTMVLPLDGGVPVVFDPGPQGAGLSLDVRTSSYDGAQLYTIEGRIKNGSEQELYALSVNVLGERFELESSGYRPGDLIPFLKIIRSEVAKKVEVKIEGLTSVAASAVYPVSKSIDVEWTGSEGQLQIKQRREEKIDLVDGLTHRLTLEVHHQGAKAIDWLEIEKRLIKNGTVIGVARAVLAKPGEQPSVQSGEVRLCDLDTREHIFERMSVHVVRYR